MTAAAASASDPAAPSLLARLIAVVRGEFRADELRLPAHHSAVARDRCHAGHCPRRAVARTLCQAHYLRWRAAGWPDLAAFTATAAPVKVTAATRRSATLDLAGLGPQARLEVAYVVQCRHDSAKALTRAMITALIGVLAAAYGESLLDRPLAEWVGLLPASAGSHAALNRALVRYAYRQLRDLADGNDVEVEFARDTWRAGRLGRSTARSPRQVNFEPVTQPWLRTAVKRWARFRLGAGKALSTLTNDVHALVWFSRFLAAHHPDVEDETALTREVVTRYISWLGTARLSRQTTTTYLLCLRGFLDCCRRYHWLSGLPVDAVIYGDDLPRPAQALPRFIPEFVMCQLEAPAALGRCQDTTTRHLFVVLMETGLRATDALALPFNPVIDDSVGWACLRFFNTKMSGEQLVPLSAKAAEAIRAQQAHLRSRWPHDPACLFPAPYGNPDGDRPLCYTTLRHRLARWQDVLDPRDEAGRPVRVTAHQFRHTLGTRLINGGVPQHVIQRLLGHASPEMTARYATIHDATVRAAFDDYQQRRVDIHGQRLAYEPDATTADAEWVKHNLARVAATLPNGYCGRPPQQDCPHPNACLTCPDFQTTPEFLQIHRRQRNDTLTLITAAEGSGKTRLAANHRQVHDNLERVIVALEAIAPEDGQPDAS